jgi:hypothetical protein
MDDGLTDSERQENLGKALDEFDQARQRLERIPPVENLVIPVSGRVTEAFQRIAGENYAQVHLGDGFAPEAIAVRDRDAQVEPEFLSYGTREQFNILVRVTLGKMLAESQGQRQLVILDDSLAHTDPERHQRMLELLQETAEQLQLIILTCRPGEYAGLGAKGYNLEELKASRKGE